jgi:hypothetical protein
VTQAQMDMALQKKVLEEFLERQMMVMEPSSDIELKQL